MGVVFTVTIGPCLDCVCDCIIEWLLVLCFNPHFYTTLPNNEQEHIPTLDFYVKSIRNYLLRSTQH